MKLKDLVAELQRSCDDGYGDYDVGMETIVRSLSTGFEYKLKADLNLIAYAKSDNRVEFFAQHFLELDDEKNRIYEKLVHTQSEYDRVYSEIVELQKQAGQTKEYRKKLKSKQKPWWKF